MSPLLSSPLCKTKVLCTPSGAQPALEEQKCQFLMPSPCAFVFHEAMTRRKKKKTGLTKQSWNPPSSQSCIFCLPVLCAHPGRNPGGWLLSLIQCPCVRCAVPIIECTTAAAAMVAPSAHGRQGGSHALTMTQHTAGFVLAWG